MRIETETKFNIGDIVYVICKEHKRNEFFSVEIVWYVLSDLLDLFDYGAVPIKIEKIIIVHSNTDVKIKYQINGKIYDECDVFTDSESAELECRKRNKG